MSLQARDSNGNGGKAFANSTLFVNTAIIRQLIDHGPGKPCEKLPNEKRFAKFDKPSDMIVEIKLDIGRDFSPSIFLFGLFQYEESGAVKGIGVAGDCVALAKAVNFIGQDILTDDNRLTTAFIEAATDERIQYLRYYTGTSDAGKQYFDNWARLFSDDADPGEIADAFLLSHSKYGWPKNYQRNKVEVDTSAAATASEGVSSTSDNEDPPW
jgi:hypothetical protein